MVKQKWRPVDGKEVEVELHPVAGGAKLIRAEVGGVTVGYVWLRNAGPALRVYSYRFADDVSFKVRGSCRDRTEAVSQMMFDLRSVGKV